MTLGVAVVGAGVVGTRRAAIAARHGSVRVIADVDADRAKTLATQHGARHTTRWQDAIADPEVAVVAVCTANKFLAPISIGALGAGKHVLCEKPMGRNASEAIDIQAAAKASGRVLKIGFTLRFHPALREAHDICARGQIGPLFMVQAAYGHGGRPGYEKEWRGDADLSGGGELLDQGVHLLDLARWFLGELEVDAALTPRWYWNIAPLEDNAFVLLRGTSGSVAMLHTSWTMWKNRFVFEVVGRDGYVRVDGLGGSYGTETLTLGIRQGDGVVPSESIRQYNGPDESWDDDWQDLVESIERQRPPEVDGAAGLDVMRLVDAVYAASRSGAARP